MAIDILNELLRYFEGFGPVGLVVFLFLVFFADAMLIPTLPELFVMVFYLDNPTPAWGAVLLTVVCVAEVASNLTLYTFVKYRNLPAWLERRMRRWVEFLVVSDERAILVNRVAPVIPFMGAFIATMKWDVRKSMFYVFIGALVKYAVLIALVGLLLSAFEGSTARNVTLAAIVAVIAVSFVQGHFAKRKHLGPVAKRVAHLGDKRAEASVGSAGPSAAHQEQPHDDPAGHDGEKHPEQG